MTTWHRHPGQWVKKAGTIKRLHTRCGDGALREHLADGWVACDEHGNVPPAPDPPATVIAPVVDVTTTKKGARGKP